MPSPATNQALDDFLSGYVECAPWASIDEQPDGNGGPPMDQNYGREDIAAETLESMRADCAAFLESNETDLESYAELRSYDPSQGSVLAYAGHDFWLTRNRHGAGFWDRGLGEVGDRLTEAAQAFGEVGLYVGDDGRIYLG